MSLNVSRLSSLTHGHFEVPITVARTGESDRAEQAVLHLNSEMWDLAGVRLLGRQDKISVQYSVDLAEGDTVTCADTTAVPTSTTWEITSRDPLDNDEWIETWLMKKTTWNVSTFPDTITYKVASSYDTYGKPTLGAAVEVSCEFRAESSRKESADGDVVETTYRFVTPTAVVSGDSERGDWMSVVVFPPGATVANADEGLIPREVNQVEDNASSGTLWEVVL